MWIHGGGFELGSAAAIGSKITAPPGLSYQGANIVQRSIDMDEPVVFVSANYRLNFFGTLSSKEITVPGVANLFLKDSGISKFGGDPNKVAVFGESAGATSISIHMVMREGNVDGRFNSAWTLSGYAPRVCDYNYAHPIFDGLIKDIGCGSAADKLACARAAPYEVIYAAVQEQTNFLSYTATLVPCPGAPQADGKIANIPYVMDNMVDEGTLFSLINQLNVTTTEDVIEYFQTVYWPRTPRAMIEHLVSLYPEDPAAGSRFGTGDLNQLGPQYERLAAMIGDYTFISGRRAVLETTGHKQYTWSYQIAASIPLLGQIGLLDALHVADLPILGSFDISDVVLYEFGTIPTALSKNSLNIMSSLITFAKFQDPNPDASLGLDLPHWPNYDVEGRNC